MKKIILILLLYPFFSTIYGQLNSDGLQDYKQSYNNVVSRQKDASFESKERKKIIKYFSKQQYVEAEEYIKKKEEKVGYGINVIVADNYFLKAKESMDNKNYKTAIYLFNKSLVYYNKAGYDSTSSLNQNTPVLLQRGNKASYGNTSSFVKRYIGLCYLQLYDNNLNDKSLMTNCYENFVESNSDDLINKYINYFSLIYIEKYKTTSEPIFLKKAYESCNNNEDIEKFDAQCTVVADILLKKYKNTNHEVEYLEYANSLFIKLDKLNRLDIAFITYEELLEYYTNSKNPIRKLRKFINYTSFSMYKDIAQQNIYKIEYENLKNENTIPAYEAFVKNNTDNPNWNESYTVLNSLLEADKLAYEEAKTTNTHQSYNQYLNNNSGGKFIEETLKQKNKLPVVTDVRGIANGSKIEIHFHLYVEDEAVFDKIYNSKGIEMTNIAGNLGKYYETGDYKIIWDVLKDTKTLEGNVTFFVEFEKKHLAIPASDELEEYVPPFSDDEYEKDIAEAEIFTVVERMPEFPGGMGKLMQYLGHNINYPPLAKESGIQGRVFMNFVVEPDGSVSNVKVLRGIGAICDEEALRVVREMPKWKPGFQRGKPVRVSYNLPIKFTLQ